MDNLWSQVSDSKCLTSFILIIIFLIITGGKVGNKVNKGYFADVLKYDPKADQWTKVGQLAKARRGHAMTKVPKDIANYCSW